MYNGGHRIRLGNQFESRRYAPIGRQQSCPRHGERAGHHRSLRAGHVFRGVIRELGRASRLLGSKSRSEGHRPNKDLGDHRPTRSVDEPTSARAGRDTKANASKQGTGTELNANRPGRTKAVVVTHSTAGHEPAMARARTRGEPRPKGPTITPTEAREGRRQS